MNHRKTVLLAATALATAIGLGSAAAISLGSTVSVESDPRQGPPLVQIAIAKPAGSAERAFTGVISARVQSNLGFRVPGKVIERLVDTGETVRAGQQLMRLDPTDLELALAAREKAVAAARALAVQAAADEARHRKLRKADWSTQQKYDEVKAASDSANAQLAAAEAEADVARNEVSYAVLLADADGTVVETLAEPGQVVADGQTVVKLAHVGPREATVNLPETVRPAIGSPAQARLYGSSSERSPTVRFVFDQDRLRLIGLSPTEAAQQLQFLLTGVTVTQVREDIRTVDVVARSSGPERLDPARLADFTLTTRDGHMIPLEQIGRTEIRMEEPLMKRRDRTATITVQSDIDEGLQPPDVSAAIQHALQPIVARLPAGYRIETGGSIEESAKANAALAKIFPIMLALMLAIIMVQVRSFPAMSMVMLTAPLGLVGAVPALLLFHQPFGFNAILGVIGLAGILMRNTLILIGQIHTNQEEGLDPYRAVVEATVQRARPVILTALAAVLAFVPLTHSVFWGSMAYTLIGGTAVGTILILVFLPALYAIWFRVKPAAVTTSEAAQPIQDVPPEPNALAPGATAPAFGVDWWRRASGIAQPVPQAAIPQHAAE